MSNKKTRAPRSHKILNRPILALFLLPVWCMAVSSIFGAAFDAIGKAYYHTYAGGVGNALVALICLSIHRGWFKGEFDGNLKTENCGKGLFLLLPAFAFLVVNLIDVDYSKITAESVIMAFFCGLGPGVLEEVAFRGLAGSNFMRVWREEKKIVLMVTLTSIIFGAVHLMNITAGAGVAVTITQTIYAFGAGVLFAGVYFRTGSLLPTMIVHTLIDFTAFMNAEVAENGGVLTDNGFEWSMVLMAGMGIVFAVLGYYYVRPAKRQEIFELWAKKWKADKPAAPEECCPEECPAEENADAE